MSEEVMLSGSDYEDIFSEPYPETESTPQRDRPEPIPYEERIKIIQNFWDEYNNLPLEFRRTRRSQESDMLDKLWLENVRQHYGVKEIESIFDAERLIANNLRKLRQSTAAILNDIKRMDERDRKRAYRARKKREKEQRGGEA